MLGRILANNFTISIPPFQHLWDTFVSSLHYRMLCGFCWFPLWIGGTVWGCNDCTHCLPEILQEFICLFWTIFVHLSMKHKASGFLCHRKESKPYCAAPGTSLAVWKWEAHSAGVRNEIRFPWRETVSWCKLRHGGRISISSWNERRVLRLPAFQDLRAMFDQRLPGMKADPEAEHPVRADSGDLWDGWEADRLELWNIQDWP